MKDFVKILKASDVLTLKDGNIGSHGLAFISELLGVKVTTKKFSDSLLNIETFDSLAVLSIFHPPNLLISAPNIVALA